jgi:hypothetical protein
MEEGRQRPPDRGSRTTGAPQQLRGQTSIVILQNQEHAFSGSAGAPDKKQVVGMRQNEKRRGSRKT